MEIRDLGEARMIARIRTRHQEVFGEKDGIGDDAALLPVGKGPLLLSTDTFVEGVHFDLSFMDGADAGWRSLAGALSDLAAMGAEPRGHLLALSLPEALPEATFMSLTQGLASMAEEAKSPLLGGNLTRSSAIQVTVTVVGEAERPVWRLGGQPGDVLAVTGALGQAALALKEFQAKRTPRPDLAQALLRPRPKLRAGVLLARSGARALTDITDGLYPDLCALFSPGCPGANVDPAAVPLPRWGDPEEALRLALFGGDDYELLVALPPDRVLAARHALADEGMSLTPIGQLSDLPGLRLNGHPIDPGGYDPYRGAPL